MKKRDLKKLAIAGLTSGLFITQLADLQANQSQHEQTNQYFAKGHCGAKCSGIIADNDKTKTASPLADPATTSPSSTTSDPNSQNLGYHVMSEKELLMELNDEGTKTYNSLDDKGKNLARLVASQRCQGSNECKGLNACKTDRNECAGKGDCKAKSKCALSDKNLAVKLVAKKMADKRNQTMNE